MPTIPSITAPRALGGPGAVNAGGVKLFTVQLVFLVLGWLFVLLRAYVRFIVVKKVGADDYLMFAAILMYTPYAIIVLHSIVYGGTGAHSVEFTLEGAMISLRAWYICEVLYSPISATIRTSIGALLLRIATDETHRRIIWVNLAVIWMSCVAYFFVSLFQCVPLDHFWMQLTGEPGACMDPKVMANTSIAFSVVAALSDWVLGLLPVAILWNVQLNIRTKVTVSLLLGMGMCAGIALLVRIPLIKSLAISTDFLYETIDTAIWTVLEPSLGIIAGCASTLRPLLETWGFSRLPGGSGYSGQGSEGTRSSGGAKNTSKASQLFRRSFRVAQSNPSDCDGSPVRSSVHAKRALSSRASTAELELKAVAAVPAVDQLAMDEVRLGKWDAERGDQGSVVSQSSGAVVPAP
ncbi:hypothetical protein GQ53DRAFT_835914 [Thozetella sp. PMI_491]|nr:hypothetical protein GQ53DRAFT_835914 [Thozetella sp. PMI_491]